MADGQRSASPPRWRGRWSFRSSGYSTRIPAGRSSGEPAHPRHDQAATHRHRPPFRVRVRGTSCCSPAAEGSGGTGPAFRLSRDCGAHRGLCCLAPAELSSGPCTTVHGCGLPHPHSWPPRPVTGPPRRLRDLPVAEQPGTRGLRRPLDPAAPATSRREALSSWFLRCAPGSSGVGVAG